MSTSSPSTWITVFGLCEGRRVRSRRSNRSMGLAHLNVKYRNGHWSLKEETVEVCEANRPEPKQRSRYLSRVVRIELDNMKSYAHKVLGHSNRKQFRSSFVAIDANAGHVSSHEG